MAPSSPPRDARLIAALAAAKVTGAAIRGLGRGGGTAAPGLVAERIDPRLLDKIARRLPQGTVVVAGTNGKTTVSRMLADILQAHGWRVAHNRSGSNLVRGVASALASQADLVGVRAPISASSRATRRHFPRSCAEVQPSVVLLNNLFRDQLDRYGELDTIASQWAPALRRLPAEATVVVNADDPTLAAITEAIGARARHVRTRRSQPELPPGRDSACRRRQDVPALRTGISPTTGCTAPTSERGAVRAAARTPFARFRGKIDRAGWRRCTASRGLAPGRLGGLALAALAVLIPGLYNAYNAVAATAVARTLGVPRQTIADALRAGTDRPLAGSSG